MKCLVQWIMQFSDTAGSTTMDGSKMDETSQRRSNQEICSSGSDQQLQPSRLRPTVIVLPSPSILVGYAFDHLIIVSVLERLNSYREYPVLFCLLNIYALSVYLVSLIEYYSIAFKL